MEARARHGALTLVTSVALAATYVLFADESSDVAQGLGFTAVLAAVGAWAVSLGQAAEARRRRETDPDDAAEHVRTSSMRFVVPLGVAFAVPLVLAVQLPGIVLDDSGGGIVLGTVVAVATLLVVRLVVVDAGLVESLLQGAVDGLEDRDGDETVREP